MIPTSLALEVGIDMIAAVLAIAGAASRLARDSLARWLSGEATRSTGGRRARLRQAHGRGGNRAQEHESDPFRIENLLTEGEARLTGTNSFNLNLKS